LEVSVAQRLRHASRLRIFLAGLLIMGLLTVPLVNFLAPLIGVAFMVHLVMTLADLAQPRPGSMPRPL
jgi:CysZ protein